MIIVLNTEEKMLYPPRWKKLTVNQSKVLKYRLYQLFRELSTSNAKLMANPENKSPEEISQPNFIFVLL